MMKRWIRYFAAVCLAALLCAAGVVFAADFDTPPVLHTGEGFTTVLTDAEGDEYTLDGVPDVEDEAWELYAGGIASYRVLYADEVLLESELRDIGAQTALYSRGSSSAPLTNGYYAVTVALSESENTYAFLTGLSPENMDEVQTKLVESAAKKQDFELEDVSFIDAEKTYLTGDGDNGLCWAAATSCILHYTGWGQRASADFKTADDLFDLFRDNFTDFGGNAIFGTEWFLNGINQPQQGVDGAPEWGATGWAQVKENYGTGSGGYLPAYYFGSVTKWLSVSNDPSGMETAMELLESGYGVAFTVGWIDENETRDGGHALSLWGYLYDADYAPSEKERYIGLIFADSDSDMQTDADRRTAPNRLYVGYMTPMSGNIYHSWKLDTYGGAVEDMFALMPYGEDIPEEPLSGGTRNRFTDYEFYLYRVGLSGDAWDFEAGETLFAEGDTVIVIPYIGNDAYKTAEDGEAALVCTLTVTPKDGGGAVFAESKTYTGEIPAFNLLQSGNSLWFAVAGLPVGEYTLTLTFNPAGESHLAEAYLGNNEYTTEIEIVAGADTSGVTFSAAFADAESGIRYDAEAYGGAYAEYAFDYAGLAAFVEGLNIENPTLTLYAAYHEGGGAFGAWERLGGTDSPETLPAAYAGAPRSDAVLFRLAVGGDNIPTYNFYSGPLELRYVRHAAAAGETNTGTYTALESGAAALADGEAFVFKVVDASTVTLPEQIDCKISLLAKSTTDGKKVVLYETERTLQNGASEEIVVTSWSADAALSGRYEIFAVVSSEYGVASASLGTLSVKEQPSTAVTTDVDTVDDYDGLISLREAVAYAKECGDGSVVTFLVSGYISLDEPISVDSDLTVQGGEETMIYGDSLLFSVARGATLTINRMILSGGSIRSEGGSVVLSGCRVIYANAVATGGGIDAEGGAVILRNCSLKGNTAQRGAAVSLRNGAALQMLNCHVFLNSPKDGDRRQGVAIYADATASAAILYTDFTDNIGGAVLAEEGAKVNLFGCIAVQNGERQFVGASLYGCYTGDAETVYTDIDKVNGTVSWSGFSSESAVGYQTGVTPRVNEGIAVKNADIDGNRVIAWSLDGVKWTVSDVPSVFGDAEYKSDALGQPHDRLYGSIACISAAALTKTEQTALTEVPEGLKALYDDTAAIETALRAALDAETGYSAWDVSFFDLALRVSEDGGENWRDAEDADFSPEGIAVTLPYPAGTTERTHDFVVIHMFGETSETLGTTAGGVEFPAVTETADGLSVTLKGLSPIGIAWRQTSSGRLPGDINGDGVVDKKDSLRLRKYLAGWAGVTVDEDVADVTGDGKVDKKDALRLRKYLAGWDVTLG